MNLLEESDDVGTRKGAHRLSLRSGDSVSTALMRRLADELDSFQPTVLGDEDPHMYAQVGELGSIVRENPTYQSGGCMFFVLGICSHSAIVRGNPTYQSGGRRGVAFIVTY